MDPKQREDQAERFVLAIRCTEQNKTGKRVFARHSRLQHSCDPNTAYQVSPDGKVVKHWALRTIAQGEQVTMCYMSSTLFDSVESMGSRDMRRALVAEANTFLCCCCRCLMKVDLSRTMRCPPFQCAHPLSHGVPRCPGCDGHALCMPADPEDTEATGS